MRFKTPSPGEAASGSIHLSAAGRAGV